MCGREGTIRSNVTDLQDLRSWHSVLEKGRWSITSQFSFGGVHNQFACEFKLEHEKLEGLWNFSLGSLLGFGGLRWDDISRETIDEDGEKALKLSLAVRRVLTDVVSMAGD